RDEQNEGDQHGIGRDRPDHDRDGQNARNGDEVGKIEHAAPRTHAALPSLSPPRPYRYKPTADCQAQPLRPARFRRTTRALDGNLRMARDKGGLTYADSGVNIDAGNRMVDLIKPLVRATARRGADAEIGGFGGVFDLKHAGFKDPVLVAATD